MRIHELIGEIGSKLQHQGVLGHLLIRERKREKGFTSSAFGQDTFIVHPKDEQRRVRKLSNDASKKNYKYQKRGSRQYLDALPPEASRASRPGLHR
jgi:hypothetical protein